MLVNTLLVTIACLAPAGDEPAWPDYRGPSLDGRAPADSAPPLRWSEEEGVRWKTPIWGRGWSSPVVHDGAIWLTTADPEGHRLAVLCLDASTGDIVLDQVLFEIQEPENRNELNSFASPSPVVGGGRVVVLFGSAGVACLDSSTREVLWSRTDLPCEHLMGAGSSPLLIGDEVVIHYDGADSQYLVSLDMSDGKTVWRTERSIDFGDKPGDLRKAYGTPVIARRNGEPVIVSTGAMATYGYSPDDGRELWRIGHVGFSMSARPIVSGEHVLINTGFGRAELWKLSLGGSGDVSSSHVGWRAAKGIPTMSTGVVASGHVYQASDGGILHCFDLDSGELRWRERLLDKVCSSLLATDDRVYIFDREGLAIVVATGPELEVLAENQLSEGCMASPAVYGDALIVRTTGHLYRLEAPASDD